MDASPRAHGHSSACRQCHTRKVRCDAAFGRPCSGCRSARVECQARERRRRNRGPLRSHSLAPLIPASERPQVEKDHATGPAPVGQHCTITPETPSEHLILLDDHDEVGQAAVALSSLQDAGDNGAGDNGVQRHLVEMLSQEDIDYRIIQKGVRIVYAGQEYSNINYLIRHRARNEAVHHFPANQISRRYTSHDLDRIPKEAFTLPPPSVVDDLLDKYFRHVNPTFPILDEEVFMEQYRGRDPQNPPSLLVLQAVLMVGAHVSLRRPDRDELKAAFFRRAKMLFDARFEWNRDVVVQAALLLTWQSEGAEDVGANSYHWVGVAARTALGLGMHRDCGPSTLVAHDKRIWRRLWWMLVQFDVSVTLSYGRPQAINLDDSDVPPLKTTDFDGLGTNVDIEFVIHHTTLCGIMSSVLRERFGLRVPLNRKKAALLQADQSLADWMANLPSRLRSDLPDSNHSACSALLHINYNNFLILLHRPPPKSADLGSIVNSDDLEICSSAASSMVGLFQSMLRRNELRLLNVFAVNALFTTMIQLSAEMRIANPVLSSNAMRKFDTALEVLRSLSEYWLNAEIILRLFEDSSERLQQELQIGKHVRRAEDGRQGSYQADSAVDIEDDPTDPANWHTILSEAAATMAHANSSVDQLGWNHTYWENSGFPYMSPFGDLELQHST